MTAQTPSASNSNPSFAPSAAGLDSAWNEYLLWLSFAVPGMLSRGNVDAMAHAIERLPAGTAMCEIGTFCGLSTCVLAHLRERFCVSSPFFTADEWSFEGQQLGSLLGESRSITHDAYREFVRDSYLRNARTFCPNDLPVTVEMDSDRFFESWRRRDRVTDVFGRSAQLGGPLGFAYIDGNHSYEFARRDFANSDSSLVPGGFILFDDSADGSKWEVNRVAREVVASGRYELVAKVPNYLVRKQ